MECNRSVDACFVKKAFERGSDLISFSQALDATVIAETLNPGPPQVTSGSPSTMTKGDCAGAGEEK